MTTFVCWKWQSRAYRVSFTAEHVNTLVDMLARYCDEPHEVLCITDDPTGVKCRTYPIWPDLAHLANPCAPPGSKQLPSCYRRLKIFDEETTNAMGFAPGATLISIDLDCVLLDNIGPLLRMFPDSDFTGWLALAGHAWRHPKYFHGSLWRFKAGKLSYLWREFDPVLSPAIAKMQGYFGSDQAWLTMRLQGRFPGWEFKHGIAAFNGGLHGVRGPGLPAGMRIVFFNGAHKPWDESVRKRWPWVAQHWPPPDKTMAAQPALV